jgi:Dynamin family
MPCRAATTEITNYQKGKNMNLQTETPSISELQNQVITLLQNISNILQISNRLLKSSPSETKYNKFYQEVDYANENVAKLSLKMAIVAPMKAGKSTIINAIAGQDLLPSRNAAMTTIPTEIILDSQLSEPRLELPLKFLKVFQETFINLQHRIRELGTEKISEIIKQYPHLTHLLEQIKANHWGFFVQPTTTGKEEITQILTGLNDTVRLAALIAPESDPLRKIIDVPCIITPFLQSISPLQTSEIGNLIIIDTPGPNEAGENLQLRGVVEQELQKSTIVLVVLDFTQLKTEAAERVKQDVQKVIDLRGKENLYVLINKVDQRRDADMTTAQVKQFVAAEFGIGNDTDMNKVFEIAARGAFVSANFLA